jgi:hypothetical protein
MGSTKLILVKLCLREAASPSVPATAVSPHPAWLRHHTKQLVFGVPRKFSTTNFWSAGEQKLSKNIEERYGNSR